MKILLFFFLIFFCESFGASPRLLVTLGVACNFTIYDLQKELGAHVVTGTTEEIKAKIKELDRSDPIHIMILEHEVENMYAFSRKVGYATLHLDEHYPDALTKVYEKIATIPLTDADLPRMDPQLVGLFYDLMMKVDRIFKEKGLSYWATCGTLLGVMRHQGMIPWDDDIDIAIFKKDVGLLLELKDALNGAGIDLCYHQELEFFKIFFKNADPVVTVEGEVCSWSYPFIDVFPLEQLEGKITYAGSLWKEYFQNLDFYTEADLDFPLSELTFGPMNIPVPCFPYEYIERLYGDDWNKVAYVFYSHKNEKVLDKIKVELIDRSPPPYILPIN